MEPRHTTTPPKYVCTVRVGAGGDEAACVVPHRFYREECWGYIHITLHSEHRFNILQCFWEGITLFHFLGVVVWGLFVPSFEDSSIFQRGLICKDSDCTESATNDLYIRIYLDYCNSCSLLWCVFDVFHMGSHANYRTLHWFMNC